MTKLKNDTKYHEVLKQAAGYSYKNGSPAPDGYKVVKSVDNKDTGFHAEVLVKGNDVIVAYRGTDITSVQDIRNDVAMARNKIPAQATDAIKVYDQVKQDYPNSDVTVTGHSLGGSLSQIVSSVRGCDAVTFNAYGTKDMFENSANIKEENIVNYVNEWDPITMSSAENHVGETYAVKGENLRNPHKLETMTDLESREYRTPENLKEHKNVLNRIENKAEHVSSKIKEKTDKIFEERKTHRTDNNSTKKSSGSCVGSYSVSGYTRSDGTKVGDYTRTCGAKH
jgi:predicted esterase YcpF (UPF0227 family)